MKRSNLLALALACLLSVLTPHHARAGSGIQYTVTGLGVLGGTSSFGSGINNQGQVVGSFASSDGYDHAFLYSGGTMQDLGTFGGLNGSAYAINDNGQITGNPFTNGSTGMQPILRSSSGAVQNLGTLGGTQGQATGINNSGQVVGWSYTSSGHNTAFLYSGSGPLQDLDSQVGLNSCANAINSNGQIAGWGHPNGGAWHPVEFNGHGGMTDLGTLGGTNGVAISINDNGQVVGWASSSTTHYRAFLFTGSGPLHDLGTLPGTDSAVAENINNLEQIVGNSYNSSGGISLAFLDDAGGPMQDLNNLIAPGSGWTLTTANGINQWGQICGTGVDPSGVTEAFLLTSVPEPAGGVILLARRKRSV